MDHGYIDVNNQVYDDIYTMNNNNNFVFNESNASQNQCSYFGDTKEIYEG